MPRSSQFEEDFQRVRQVLETKIHRDNFFARRESQD